MSKRWEVRKSMWPYPDGYAVYDARERLVLDSGLSREAAQALCNRMNKEKEDG
jgi:hypothetical protein